MLLEPGERVLWLGRPRPRLLPRREDAPTVLVGLVLLLVAIAWIAWPLRQDMALNHGTGLLLLVLGLPLAGGAVALLVAPVLADRARTRRLRYMLTNRRAAILTTGPEPDMAFYPLTQRMPLRLRGGGPLAPGSVLFARDVRTLPGRAGGRRRVEAYDVGFERIDDAETVFGLMRRLCGQPAP
jgi:hypothetical protein